MGGLFLGKVSHGSISRSGIDRHAGKQFECIGARGLFSRLLCARSRKQHLTGVSASGRSFSVL